MAEEASTIRTDVLIVGAGPAGIFTALGLLRRGDRRSITMVEKGLPIERRRCPREATGHCAGCAPCRITTGFSGAGAFSDGKLSLSPEVGGDLPQLVGTDVVADGILRVDDIYLGLGADPHVEGVGHPKSVADIRRRAIKAGLKLVDCPIRHLGTEKAQQIYARVERELLDAGVRVLFEHECLEVLVQGEKCLGAVVAPTGRPQAQTKILAAETVVATGRRGALWFDEMCAGGFVSQENYDGGLAVVNGHSYKERKSPNTNLAVLVSFNFRQPFHEPIAYAQHVGRLMNMLGAGHILVQRFGDVLEGKRTWPKELSRSNVVPTLADAEAGDITAAMPYRAMTEIVAFMQAVDLVVPGFAADETLLYAPELKFYSNRVVMDEHLDTNVAGLHCLGDSSGWTRGLMMSSVMGLLMGEELSSR